MVYLSLSSSLCLSLDLAGAPRLGLPRTRLSLSSLSLPLYFLALLAFLGFFAAVLPAAPFAALAFPAPRARDRRSRRARLLAAPDGLEEPSLARRLRLARCATRRRNALHS